MHHKGRCIMIVVTIIVAMMSMVGCHKGSQQADCSTFDSTKKYISQYVDSSYSNPRWMSLIFDSIARHSTDSASVQLAMLYNSFCHYLTTGDKAKALQEMEQVNQYCRSHKGTEALSSAYWNMRSIFAQEADSAIYCLEQARKTLENTSSRYDMIAICMNLADNYRIAGKLPEAVLYWRRSMQLCDSLGNTKPRDNILIGLGQCYSDMFQFDMADAYFKRVDSTCSHYNTLYLLRMAQGNSYYVRNDFAAAHKCFNDALKAASHSNSDMLYLPLYINLSEINTLTEHYDSAHYYLSKARPLLDESVTVGADYYIYSLSADLAFRQQRDDDAVRYLDSLKQCKDVSLTYQYLHKRRMMQHFVRNGDYKKAYEYRKEVDAYDDSIRKISVQSTIAEIDSRYSRDTTLLKQQLLISAGHETQLHLRITLIITFGVIIALALIVMIKGVQHKRHEERIRLAAHNHIAQLRMQITRNRVTPHLILNALHTARADTSNPIYMNLIDVIRDNLSAGENIAVSIDDEMRIVRHYVELYQLTHAATTTIEIRREKTADSHYLIPSMSIQIPVENALKHAFDDTDTDRHIDVHLYAAEGMLHVRVTDNGHGYDSARYKPLPCSTGNGLHILYQTFDILNKFNQHSIRFEIVSPVSDGRGTRVELDIPENYDYTFNKSPKE